MIISYLVSQLKSIVLDDPFQYSNQPRVVSRRKESRNSLRNLFTRVSSKWFKETDKPHFHDFYTFFSLLISKQKANRNKPVLHSVCCDVY